MVDSGDDPAQLVAPVDLSLKRLWVFTKEDIVALAQQRSGGRYHIYLYTEPDPTREPKKADRLTQLHEFEKYRLENRAHEGFGV